MRPLHTRVLISERVSSAWLIENAVCSTGSVATNAVHGPVATTAVGRQPVKVLALHRAPLITDTVSPLPEVPEFAA
jgi:hypothetical protein